MASITILFTGRINTSCQTGDTAYAVDTTTDGGFSTNNGSITTIGQVRELAYDSGTNVTTMVCDTSLSDASLVHNKFILFGKDRRVNSSSITGYYGEAKMICDATDYAELFSLNVETSLSSK